MKEVTFKQFQEELVSSFEKFQKSFDNEGIFWFAHSGTLLGAVRENSIIEWDDDIDMAMFNDDFYKNFEKINKIAKDNNFTLYDPSKTWGLDVGRLFSDETYLVEYEGNKYVTQIYIDINLALPIKGTNKIREKWWEIANKYSWIYGDFYNILPKTGWIKGKVKEIGAIKNFFAFVSKLITFVFMFWVPIYQNKKVKKITKRENSKYQFFYCWNPKETFYEKNEFEKINFNNIEINIQKNSKEYLVIWYGSNWKEKPEDNKRKPHNLILTPHIKGREYKIRPFLIK